MAHILMDSFIFQEDIAEANAQIEFLSNFKKGYDNLYNGKTNMYNK